MVRRRVVLPAALLAAAIVGCSGAPSVPEEVAALVAPPVVEGLVEDPQPEDLHPVLERAVKAVQPPAGVEGVELGNGFRLGSAHGNDLATFVVVVRPEEGPPWCAILGVADDGTTDGVRASGDPDDDCRTAQPAEPASPLIEGWPVWG